VLRAKAIARHSWLLTFPLLTILGSILQSHHIGYILIIAIAIAIGLAAFGKIEHKLYPWLLFSIGLSLVWQTTLASSYLVGTDIHLEYYYAQATATSGSWNYTMPCAYNSAMGTVLFTPLAANLLHIDTAWLLKVVPPLFLAGVPVVLYYMFKSQISEKAAFLAATFFIIVPVFAMEVPALARQEYAMLFLVLCMMLIVVRIEGLGKWRVPLIIATGILVALNHYSMWVMLMVFLIVALPVSAIAKQLGAVSTLSSKHLSIATATILLAGLGYYCLTSQGVIIGKLIWLIPNFAVAEYLFSMLPAWILTLEVAPIPITDAYYEPLMMMAMGQDFTTSISWGNLFRIVQYLTQVLIAVGGVFILYRIIRYRQSVFTAEYFGFVTAGVVLIILCFTCPAFSWTMNASRIYHIALLGLAPLFVIGGKLVLRHYKWLVLGVLLPYFAFTSGAVFELTTTSSIETINMPYNIALSNHRLDLSGSFSQADIVVRDWASAQNLNAIYSDFHGANLLAERYGIHGVEKLPHDLAEVPSDSYIFLRERNEQEQMLVYWTGAGMRKFVSYEEADISILKESREVLYKSGDAILLGPHVL